MSPENRKIRVAFTVSRLGVGGAERQLVSLVNALDRRHFEPSVICLKDLGPMARSITPGVRLVELEHMNGSDPRVLRVLIPALRNIEADVVHCTNFNATAWARAAAIRLGIPVVTAEHSTLRSSRREWIMVRSANTLFDSRTFAVVACAEAQVDSLVSEGCAQSHIRVIHNGVDRSFAADAGEREHFRRELGIGEQDVVVTIVASLAPQKNHALFVEMAARLRAQDAPCRFLIVGEGACREEIEASVRENGLGGVVHLLGARTDVPRVLAGTDVVALTSLPVVETFPMCLLEAMAAGLPVVATAVGGIPEMVEPGVTGELVPSGGAEELVRAIRRLAGDPVLRAGYGDAGRKRVAARFSIRAMAKAYEDLLQEAVRTSCA